MRTFCFILLLTCPCVVVMFAQKPIVGECEWEIYVGHDDTTQTYSVQAVNVGALMWGAAYSLTDSILGTPTFEVKDTSLFQSPNDSWPYGFDFINSIEDPGGLGCTRLNSLRYVPYGFFRLDFVNEPPGHSIYLDLRDDRYGITGSGNLDLWLKWNPYVPCFYFRPNGDTTWHQYSAGSTIHVWTYIGGSQSTGKFQPTAPGNLAVTPYNGNPQLTWNASSGYLTGYNVYRNWNNGYQKIATVTSTSYIDYDVTWSGNNNNHTTIYYYVTAVNNPTESQASNTVYILINPKIQKWNGALQELPANTALLQNYPNPFNPGTDISFTVASEGRVSVTIYNEVGELVKVLVNSSEPVGTHTVHWDGKDEKGKTASSGVYLCELRFVNNIEWKKMMLVK